MGSKTMSCAVMSSCDEMVRRKSRDSLRPTVIGLAVACLSMPTGACAQSNASQPTTAQAVSDRVDGAKPGDRIVLATGDYGPLKLKGRKFAAPGVVIEAAPGAKVTFSSIVIDGLEGLTIKGVDVDITSENYGVTVVNASRVTLSGLKIHAPKDKSPNAMILRYDHEVTVEDCEIHDVSFGIAFLESDHLRILRNNFTDLQVDSIRGSSSYTQVIGNHAQNFHPHQGDHPDFIQFWGPGQGARDKGNVIRDNVYQRGDGDVAQGIFIGDNEDIEITGNALLGSMYNAIALASVNRALVEGNFVQSYDDMGARIVTRGVSSDVTVRNNVTPDIVNYAEGGKPNPGYKEENNKSIRSVKIGETKDLQAWLAKRPAPKAD